jgi:hypothetical protein
MMGDKSRSLIDPDTNQDLALQRTQSQAALALLKKSSTEEEFWVD